MDNDAESRKAQEQITHDLLASGLRKGGAVLVHSSLSSMGHVAGGAKTVIRGLLDALGPEGTLLMPALSWELAYEKRPVFDFLHTPSSVGAVTEYFRTRPGTIRSLHPTHSVCGVGRLAKQMLKNHRLDHTPCGPNSAYRALKEADGQVLFLGCGMRPNTSMHAVEELVEPPPWLGPTVVYRVILADGSQTEMQCRRHNFGDYAQRYDRLSLPLKDAGLTTGKVLKADAHIVECRAMWRQALAAMKREPLFFVEKKK